MKRSTGIVLVLTCSVAAFAGGRSLIDHFTAPSGGEAAPEEMFRDAADCASRYDRAACEAKAAEAYQAHEASAPHYADRQACEEEYGQGFCDVRLPSTAGGSASFVPAMVGFVAGAALASAVTPLRYVPLRDIPAGGGPGGLDCAKNIGARQLPACMDARPMTGGTGTNGGRSYFYRTSTSSGGSTAGPALVARSGSVEGARVAAASGRSGSGSVARGGFGASAGAHAGAGE